MQKEIQYKSEEAKQKTLLYGMLLSNGRGRNVHSEFEGGTEAASLSWNSECVRALLVEKRGEEVAEQCQRGTSVGLFFSFFFPFHAPAFSFPKLKITRKGLRMKILIGDVLLKCYKRNNSISFFSLLYHSYNKPWVMKCV